LFTFGLADDERLRYRIFSLGIGRELRIKTIKANKGSENGGFKKKRVNVVISKIHLLRTKTSPPGFYLQPSNVQPIPPGQLNPQLPDQLNGIILKCLAKDPEERYQNVPELMAAIESVDRQTNTCSKGPDTPAYKRR